MGFITGDSIAYPAEGFKRKGADGRTFMHDFLDFHTIFYEICILYCKNAYDIMPIGKKIMLFHSEQQRKTLGVRSEGFSIPNSGVERLNSTG